MGPTHSLAPIPQKGSRPRLAAQRRHIGYHLHQDMTGRVASRESCGNQVVVGQGSHTAPAKHRGARTRLVENSVSRWLQALRCSLSWGHGLRKRLQADGTREPLLLPGPPLSFSLSEGHGRFCTWGHLLSHLSFLILKALPRARFAQDKYTEKPGQRAPCALSQHGSQQPGVATSCLV